MVSGQFCFLCWPTVNQREGQIITEYLAVLVESRIKCETSYKVLIFWLRKASRLEPRLCLFFLSSCFFKNFFSPLVSCVLYLSTVLRGCFTPIGLIQLSLLLSSPFLSLFSSLFSFSSFLFSLSFLPSFLFSDLSLQIFGAATAAMPHRFRRACRMQVIGEWIATTRPAETGPYSSVSRNHVKLTYLKYGKDH